MQLLSNIYKRTTASRTTYGIFRKIRRKIQDTVCPQEAYHLRGVKAQQVETAMLVGVPAFTERLSKQNHFDLMMMPFVQVAIQIEIG